MWGKKISDRDEQEEINHNQIFLKIKLAFFYFRSFLPLLLSHHPACESFKGHTINIKKIRLCIGCFVGYPTAVLGIILIDLLNLDMIISSEIFLILGIIFISSFFLSLLNLIRNKALKILQKFLIGLGASFLFWGIMLLPNPKILNIWIAFMTLSFLIGLLNIYHTYTFYRNCAKCEIPFDWARCDGLLPIRNNLKKHNLKNVFQSFDIISEHFLAKRKEREEHE